MQVDDLELNSIRIGTSMSSTAPRKSVKRGCVGQVAAQHVASTFCLRVLTERREARLDQAPGGYSAAGP